MKQKPSWEENSIMLRAVGCIAVVAAVSSVDGVGMNSVRKETV